MKKIIFALCVTAMSFASCTKDDDAKLPPIEVNFDATESGIDNDETEVTLSLSLSRAAASEVTVTLNASAEGIAYTTDYTTAPELTDNVITLTIPAGNTSAEIGITKTADVIFNGSEAIVFTLSGVSGADDLRVGAKKTTTLTFKTISSAGGELTLQGKVEAVVYANSVFVDFSANKQTPIDRTAWALGFYCGAEHTVFLNSAYAVTAAPTSKSDINAVTVADTAGLANIAGNPMSEAGLSIAVIDNVDGSVANTVFKNIAENEADNKVFLVATADDKTKPEDFYKVKVTRTAAGYKVQYGKLAGGTVTTVEVAKDANYNLVFLSLKTGSIVNVEPKAKNWDIEWSYGTGLTGPLPYFMQDLFFINNLAGVTVASINTTETPAVTYESFATANIAGLTFSNSRMAIGTSWRSVGGMGGAASVYDNMFYVVKDATGNYYKFKVVEAGLGASGGVRGLPKIKYDLVK